MSRQFLTPINLNGNELQNFRVQMLGADPTLTEARLWYNSTDNVLRYYDGTSVIDIGSVGAIAAEDVSVDNSGFINFSGADVQEMFEQLDAAYNDPVTALSSHANPAAVGAHTAANISVDSTNLTGTGNDVQEVLEELETQIDSVDGVPAMTNGQVIYGVGTVPTAGSPDTAGLVDKGSTQTSSGLKTWSGRQTYQGAMFHEHASVTGSAAIASGDSGTTLYTGSGGHTITLPAATTNGRRQRIYNRGSGAAITISRAGTDTIEGATSISLAVGEMVELHARSTGTWYSATIRQADVFGLTAALALKAPLADPVFTGNPQAPDPLAADNDQTIPTTAWVKARIADLVGTAPGLLDTLGELSDALGDDPNFATTITTSLASKAGKYTQTIVGTATSEVITHNLGTRAVVVSVHDAATYDEVGCDVQKTSANTITLGFAVAPAAGAYVVTVVG